MACKKNVVDALHCLREEFDKLNMTVAYEGIYQGLLLFSTHQIPSPDGQVMHTGYPLFVLVDQQDFGRRKYVPDIGHKIAAAIERKNERKKKKAAKA